MGDFTHCFQYLKVYAVAVQSWYFQGYNGTVCHPFPDIRKATTAHGIASNLNYTFHIHVSRHNVVSVGGIIYRYIKAGLNRRTV